jgi:hypothetical protein
MRHQRFARINVARERAAEWFSHSQDPQRTFRGKRSIDKERRITMRWEGSRMRLLLAVVFTILGSGQCFAQEEKATIVGAGWVTCAEFAKAYQQNPQSTEDEFFGWAQGYLSGLNDSVFVRKNLRGWRLEQQKQHIRAFCDKRSLANFRDAVKDLFSNLPDR